MKSCPVCKRTFDDLLTFCLVDGSILSAPFDPHNKQSPVDKGTSEPPATLLIEEPTRPAPPPTRALPTSANEKPSNTIASESSLPATQKVSGPRGSAPKSDDQSAMKTMVAPPPENVFIDHQRSPAVAGEPPSGKNRRPLVITAMTLSVVAVVVAGGWFALRSWTHKAPSAQAAALPTDNSKAATPITGPTFDEKIAGADVALVSLPGGSFLMGSVASDPERDPDEGPQSTVTLPPFYMSKFEITQAQYRAVMGTDPARFKGDELPVDSVSWSDATEFCKKLSAQTGHVYRLPTEAEWEYAARAGGTDADQNRSALGWCGSNSEKRTHPVGQKQPNAFGLYDMYGNVWEWCQSEYKAYPYQSGDGRESLNANAVHVLRGGSWEASNRACRPTYRRRVVPEPATSGFRVVLVP